jgi:hypothetical protein
VCCCKEVDIVNSDFLTKFDCNTIYTQCHTLCNTIYTHTLCNTIYTHTLCNTIYTHTLCTVKLVYNDTLDATKMCCYDQVVVVTRTYSTETIESVPAMCVVVKKLML